MAPAQSDDGMPQDAMVIVAALVSRVEALVIASMLEAAGIQVCVGASGHASIEIISLGLGGTVCGSRPASMQQQAPFC